MLYWIQNNIGSAKGILQKGQFHTLDGFSSKTIQTLLEKGVIRQIKAPNLRIMPELLDYGILLENAGYRTLLDVLERQTELATIITNDKERQKIVDKAERMLRPDMPASG